jgi:hypothetical protein
MVYQHITAQSLLLLVNARRWHEECVKLAVWWHWELATANDDNLHRQCLDCEHNVELVLGSEQVHCSKHCSTSISQNPSPKTITFLTCKMSTISDIMSTIKEPTTDMSSSPPIKGVAGDTTPSTRNDVSDMAKPGLTISKNLDRLPAELRIQIYE